MVLGILIIGVGNPIPTFIERRLNALAKANLKLKVALSYRQMHNLHPNIEVLRYGQIKQMRFVDAVRFLVLLASHPFIFARVFNLLSAHGYLRRLKLAVHYFPLAVIKNIHLIHVQWIGHVVSIYWLKKLLKAPLITSVRGSQVTVYPVTRKNYTDIILSAFQHADACHLVSYGLMKHCLALGATADKLFVNYNGIDLNLFKPPAKKAYNEQLRIISVGGLIWRKGYLFQLILLQRLLAVGINASLKLIGSGNDAEGLQYTAMVMGLDKAVSFVRQLSEEQISESLSEADVYLSTSLAEGLPNSLVEAAACGLPIVAFNCEGIDEVVKHEISGFIVQPGDLDQAVFYIKKLTDFEVRKNMGLNARAHIEKTFNQSICVQEMKSFYKRVVQGEL